jgi:hypothetical protein
MRSMPAEVTDAKLVVGDGIREIDAQMGLR